MSQGCAIDRQLKWTTGAGQDPLATERGSGAGAHANCCKPPRQLHLFNGALVGNGNATVGQKGGRRVGWGVAGSWHRSGDGDGSVDGS